MWSDRVADSARIGWSCTIAKGLVGWEEEVELRRAARAIVTVTRDGF